VVAVAAMSLESKMRRRRLSSLHPSTQDANGRGGERGGERRTAPRATNRLAHRAFANRNQPSGI
jgi:hypothetical protein